MAKTKSGKREMNPTDAYRKEQRKREIKKNKRERTKVREFSALIKNPAAMAEEIKRLESLDSENKLSRELQNRLVQYKRTYKDLVRIQKREEQAAAAGPKVSFDDEEAQRGIERQSNVQSAFPAAAEIGAAGKNEAEVKSSRSAPEAPAQFIPVVSPNSNPSSFPMPLPLVRPLVPPFLSFPPGIMNVPNFPVPPPPPPRQLGPVLGPTVSGAQLIHHPYQKDMSVSSNTNEMMLQPPPPPFSQPPQLSGIPGKIQTIPAKLVGGGKNRQSRARREGISTSVDPLDPMEEGYTMRPSEWERKAREMAELARNNAASAPKGEAVSAFGPVGPSLPSSNAQIGPQMGPCLPDSDSVTGDYPTDNYAIGPYPNTPFISSSDAPITKPEIKISKDLVAMVPAHLRTRRVPAEQKKVKTVAPHKDIVPSVPRPAGATVLMPRGLKAQAKAPVTEAPKNKNAVGDEYAAFMAEMKELGAL